MVCSMHKFFALSLTITCLKDHRRLKSKHFTFGVLIAWIISLDFEIFYVYTSTSYVLSQMVHVHINKHSVSPPRKMNMVDSWTSQKLLYSFPSEFWIQKKQESGLVLSQPIMQEDPVHLSPKQTSISPDLRPSAMWSTPIRTPRT